MSSSSLSHTLDVARTRWLDGDAAAWAHYVECCLRLEAEHQRNQHADRPPRLRHAGENRPGAERRSGRKRKG